MQDTLELKSKLKKQRLKFRPFSEAKLFIQSLNFKNKDEYMAWAKTSLKPTDIPATPERAYKTKGWKGWGDYLGTGRIANQDRKFIPFVNAKSYAQTLGFKTQNEWRLWAKTEQRPDYIPANPPEAYSSEWDSWGDFLGTERIANQDKEFTTFEEARAFAHKLGFKNRSEWLEWSKTEMRPSNIPAYPSEVFAKRGWKSWGDFLGTGTIATHKLKYRTYIRARGFVRKLQLKSKKDWDAYSKSDIKPKDIPANPHQTYANKGWVGYSDFLGCDVISRWNRIYRTFEAARTFARGLNLRSISQWEEWAKTAARPKDIPKQPHHVYKKLGWVNYCDFLGYDRIANQKRKYQTYEASRAFVHTLNLNNRADFWKWTQLNELPIGIPKAPDIVYKRLGGWKGWGDWLGSGYIAAKDREYKAFHDAKKYVQTLGIKSQTAWSKWSATEARPRDIPGNPQHTYSKEWKGWGDWLGTGKVANQNREWKAFDEARAYARSLNFAGKNEWTEWAKSENRPVDIPSYPNEVYLDKGWCGWQDWLGLFNNWNINNVKAFVSSLLPHLNTLSPAGLHVLFQQTGLEVSNHNKSKSFLQAFKTGKFPREELEKFVSGEKSLVDGFVSNAEFTLNTDELGNNSLNVEDNVLYDNDINETKDFLPYVDAKEILTSLDSKIFSNLDNEAVEFFIQEAIAKIWQQAYSYPLVTFRKVTEHKTDGPYSSEVKRIFLEDYQYANELKIPDGYDFKYPPNLMQRYTAYLVKSRKRIGNWSGTGAGKTLSAVLASRVINAKLTVICCPNNVVGNWEDNIKAIYPDSIYISKSISLENNANKHNYVILNYEFFQQPTAQSKLLKFLNEHSVDFVIIDEIHFSKQRQVEKMSQRKKVVAAFLSEANARNENLHVLGMSATPVINNLFEGKTLVELVAGVHHDDLQTKPTIDNCIALYQKFVTNGIRWLPKYDYQLNIHTESIDCSDIIPEIKNKTLTGSMVDLEILLTNVKIPFILQNIKPKTIVYTHYIKDILIPLQSAIEQYGWRVSVFTGENKSGLDEFIVGGADVLIASSCVGTGVDKLQYVCNRLIVNCLPWTHAEFEQLKGRIYRQGQIQDHVDIFIPLTNAVVNGEKWSWCESRWKRIQFKRSISDAAVDGVIPEGHLRTPAQAYKDAMLWLERLKRGEMYEIERRKISIPLIDNVEGGLKLRLGDLTKMNYNINQSSSSDTYNRFQRNPEEWEAYHSTYREDRKDWPVIPYQEAIKWFGVKGREHMVIGDFGCGEAFLSEGIPNKVYSFDHIAINANVLACDMSHTPLDDSCLDAAVFSLSLMGINYIDYLKEAHRCLKLDGHLWICEPTSRLNEFSLFRELLFRLGFDIARVDEKWKFTFIRAIKSERQPNYLALENFDSKLALS